MSNSRVELVRAGVAQGIKLALDRLKNAEKTPGELARQALIGAFDAQANVQQIAADEPLRIVVHVEDGKIQSIFCTRPADTQIITTGNGSEAESAKLEAAFLDAQLQEVF